MRWQTSSHLLSVRTQPCSKACANADGRWLVRCHRLQCAAAANVSSPSAPIATGSPAACLTPETLHQLVTSAPHLLPRITALLLGDPVCKAAIDSVLVPLIAQAATAADARGGAIASEGGAAALSPRQRTVAGAPADQPQVTSNAAPRQRPVSLPVRHCSAAPLQATPAMLPGGSTVRRPCTRRCQLSLLVLPLQRELHRLLPPLPPPSQVVLPMLTISNRLALQASAVLVVSLTAVPPRVRLALLPPTVWLQSGCRALLYVSPPASSSATCWASACGRRCAACSHDAPPRSRACC